MVNSAKGGTKASEMAQPVQVLVAKVGDPSLYPRDTPAGRRELPKVVRDLSICAVSRRECGCTIKANVSSFARP